MLQVEKVFLLHLLHSHASFGRKIAKSEGDTTCNFVLLCVFYVLNLIIIYFQLPIKIDIIKHPQEIDGKSTAIHGCILAPEDVKIYTYPDLPDTSKGILVFPSSDAEDAEDFMKRTKQENGGQFPYDRIIFVDSTWNQTNKIRQDPKICSKLNLL